jgi:FMN phosphatase YigB (HAD superfamily)
MKPVRSFDVFDTCLIRKSAAPSGVFYEVAGRALAQHGLPPDRAAVEDFVAARIQSEKLARQQAAGEEVSLADIWRILARSLGWPFEDSLLTSELAAEEAALSPIVSIWHEVREARRQGCRIIFISDIYLPGGFIEAQLIRHGFAEKGDGIYVSSETGKTKASGNLFRHVLAQEQVPASAILHTGDHEKSDVAVPKKLGFRVRHFRESRLTGPEAGLLAAHHEMAAPNRLAGAMRAFRLGGGPQYGDDINELASQFVAPFVLAFATWVLQRAQATGVRRLYFFSRDCQLVGKVAGELSPQFGDIDCRYLYVSRQALFLPSATAVSPEGMPWLGRSPLGCVLKEQLAKMELTFEDVRAGGLGEMAGAAGGEFRLLTEAHWQAFWGALNQEPLRTRIIDLIRQRQAAAQRYFTAAGLYEPETFAMVDFGWYLTGQRSLWKMLQGGGWTKRMRGFYLALRCERVGSAQAGDAEALFYHHQGMQEGFAAADLYLHQTLLEHIVGCADHPSVHHYQETADGKAGPAFVTAMDRTTQGFCEKLHGCVLEFVAQNRGLAEDFKNPAFCQEALTLLAGSYFRHPARGATRALAGLSIATDQNGSDAQAIVRPLDVYSALLPLLPRRGPLKPLWRRRDFFWEEGSIAVSSPGVQGVSRVVRRLAGWRARIKRSVTH